MKKSTSAALLLAGTAAVSAYLGVNTYMNMALKRRKTRSSAKLTGKLTGDLAEYAEEIRAGSEWLFDQDCETVKILSRDGLRLYGHWLPAENAKRTILLMHGFRSSWSHDFSGVARYYHEIGCNLLFAEQRTHGFSEGKYIGYGVLERFDCIDWIEYIAARFGTELPIYADGISMGATTVLMAAGLGYPDYVRGIIADCGFTSPKAIIGHVMKTSMKIPGDMLLSAADAVCKGKTGYSIGEYSTVEAMKTNDKPVLFVHGDADEFVPLEMTLENYEACTAEKQLLIVEGAGHGTSYLRDTARCREALESFFAAHDGVTANVLKNV